MTKVLITKKAYKQLEDLHPIDRDRVRETIDSLSDDPLPLGKKVKKLKDPEIGFRIRVGNLRIKYTLEKDVVTIYLVGPRDSVYK